MRILRDLGACPEAIDWASGRDPEQAWMECPRGDWLLWLADKLKVDRKLIVTAACDCAELTIHLCEDERSREALKVARAWVAAEATLEQVRVTADAAYAAADAAYAAAAAAARSAAYAAIRTAAAANAAAARSAADAAWSAAAWSADAAWSAAAWSAAAWSAAADAAAREETLAKCADIVRGHIPWSVIDNSIKEMQCKLII